MRSANIKDIREAHLGVCLWMLFQRGLTESGGHTLMVENTIPGDGVAAGLGRGKNHLGTMILSVS